MQHKISLLSKDVRSQGKLFKMTADNLVEIYLLSSQDLSPPAIQELALLASDAFNQPMPVYAVTGNRHGTKPNNMHLSIANEAITPN